MKKVLYILIGVALLLSCGGKKNASDSYINDMEEVVTDSMPLDSLHHPLPGEFEDGHMPPPPPPDGRHHDGPPPPPPHGKGRPHHEHDNMRGFDPASEDDMDDNGMSPIWRITMKEGGTEDG